MLKKFSAIALATLLCASHSAFAADCEAQAAEKKLAGAAKSSFVKKCMKDNPAVAACEAKAVDKNGKPLAGAAKASSVKKCVAEAK